MQNSIQAIVEDIIVSNTLNNNQKLYSITLITNLSSTSLVQQHSINNLSLYIDYTA